MFANFKNQEHMRKMESKLEEALLNLNILLSNADAIVDVDFVSDADDKKVFENPEHYIRLEIRYTDHEGRINKMRKDALDEEEKRIMEDLERLKRERIKYE